MKILNEADKAYIAGVLDSDGCIGISKTKSLSKAYKYDFRIRLIITNGNYELIKWLKQKTGIGCAHKTKYQYQENWNTVHRWQVVTEKAKGLLREVLPYLKVKKHLAEIAIDFPSYGRTGKSRTVEQYEKQKDLFKLFKQLNKRGVKSVKYTTFNNSK